MLPSVAHVGIAVLDPKCRARKPFEEWASLRWFGLESLGVTFPDPLKDPKNGSPQNDPHYYIGETRASLGGSIFWIL